MIKNQAVFLWTDTELQRIHSSWQWKNMKPVLMTDEQLQAMLKETEQWKLKIRSSDRFIGYSEDEDSSSSGNVYCEIADVLYERVGYAVINSYAAIAVDASFRFLGVIFESKFDDYLVSPYIEKFDHVVLELTEKFYDHREYTTWTAIDILKKD